MPPESPDLLLLVGADLSLLNQQIAQLRQSLNLNIDLSQGLQRSAVAAQQLQTNLGGAARSLSDVGSAAATATTSLQSQQQIARDLEARYRQMLGITLDHGRAIQANEQLIQRAGQTQARAILDNDRLIQQSGQTQARAIQETTARIAAQERAMASFFGKLGDTVPKGVEQQIQAITAANQRLQAGIPLTTTEWTKTRQAMDEVSRAGIAQRSVLDNLTTAIINKARWLATLAVGYAALRGVMATVSHFVEVDRQLTLISATMEKNANVSAEVQNAYRLMIPGMTQLGMSAKESGAVVFELSKALDNNVTLIEAALIPALTLAGLKETNQADTIRVLVGAYKIYGDSIEGATTPTEKFSRILDMLTTASFQSIGNTADFATALQLVGPRAKQAGLSLAETLTLLQLTQNAMVTASRSGTGLFRLLEDIELRAPIISRIFDIPFDVDKPVSVLSTILEVIKKVRAAGVESQEILRNIKIAFPDVRGEREFRTLLEMMDAFFDSLAKTEKTLGQGTTAFNRLTEAVGASAKSLGNVFFVEIDRVLSTLAGVDPGKMQGTAIAIQAIANAIANVFFALNLFASIPGGIKSAIDSALSYLPTFGVTQEQMDQEMIKQGMKPIPRTAPGTKLSKALAPYLSLFPPDVGVGADVAMGGGGFGRFAPPEIPRELLSQKLSTRAGEILANISREAAISDKMSPFSERLGKTQEDLAESEARLRRAREAFLQGGAAGLDQAKGLGKSKEQTELEAAAREVEQRRKQVKEIRVGELVGSGRIEVDQEKREAAAADAVREIHRKLTTDLAGLRKFDTERAQEAIWEQYTSQVATNSLKARDEQDLIELNDLAWKIYTEKREHEANRLLFTELKLNDEREKREAEAAHAVMGVHAKLSGELAKLKKSDVSLFEDAAFEEYAAQVAVNDKVARSSEELSTLMALGWQVYTEKVQKYHRDNAVKILQEEGILHAKTSVLLQDGANRAAIIAEAKAGKELSGITAVLTARAGAAQKELAYYSNRRNLAEAVVAAEIRENEKWLQTRLNTLETINGKEARQRDLTLSIRQQEAQAAALSSDDIIAAAGHTFDFFVLGLRRQADASGDFFKGIDALAAETYKAMARSMSDFFFNVFTGQVTSMQELWQGFTTSMLRAVSDFMAAAVVRQFLGLLFGGTTLGGEGGLVGAGIGLLGGLLGNILQGGGVVGGSGAQPAVLHGGEVVISRAVRDTLGLGGDATGITEVSTAGVQKLFNAVGFGRFGPAGQAATAMADTEFLLESGLAAFSPAAQRAGATAIGQATVAGATRETALEAGGAAARAAEASGLVTAQGLGVAGTALGAFTAAISLAQGIQALQQGDVAGGLTSLALAGLSTAGAVAAFNAAAGAAATSAALASGTAVGASSAGIGAAAAGAATMAVVLAPLVLGILGAEGGLFHSISGDRSMAENKAREAKMQAKGAGDAWIQAQAVVQSGFAPDVIMSALTDPQSAKFGGFLGAEAGAARAKVLQEGTLRLIDYFHSRGQTWREGILAYAGRGGEHPFLAGGGVGAIVAMQGPGPHMAEADLIRLTAGMTPTEEQLAFARPYGDVNMIPGFDFGTYFGSDFNPELVARYLGYNPYELYLRYAMLGFDPEGLAAASTLQGDPSLGWDFGKEFLRGGFAEGGIARVHDGEVMVPRPFADEFPALARALARRDASGSMGHSSVVINLNVDVRSDRDLSSPTFWRGVARMIDTAIEEERVVNRRRR